MKTVKVKATTRKSKSGKPVKVKAHSRTSKRGKLNEHSAYSVLSSKGKTYSQKEVHKGMINRQHNSEVAKLMEKGVTKKTFWKEHGYGAKKPPRTHPLWKTYSAFSD